VAKDSAFRLAAVVADRSGAQVALASRRGREIWIPSAMYGRLSRSSCATQEIDELCRIVGSTPPQLVRDGILDTCEVQRTRTTSCRVVLTTTDGGVGLSKAVEALASPPGVQSPGPIAVAVNGQSVAPSPEILRSLQQCARRIGVDVTVFLPGAREHLVQSIASSSKGLVACGRFCLGLDQRPSVRVGAGAGRNLLTLVTLGCRVISVDDDVALPVARTGY
jgi:hypothetical protein